MNDTFKSIAEKIKQDFTMPTSKPTPVLPECRFCGCNKTREDPYTKGRIICGACDRDIKLAHATPPPSSVSREGEMSYRSRSNLGGGPYPGLTREEVRGEGPKEGYPEPFKPTNPPAPMPLTIDYRERAETAEKALLRCEEDMKRWTLDWVRKDKLTAAQAQLAAAESIIGLLEKTMTEFCEWIERDQPRSEMTGLYSRLAGYKAEIKTLRARSLEGGG